MRAEEEIDLDENEFERLWRLTEGRRLEKRRHEIEYSERTLEVDVFRGALDGLVVAEVEFPDEDAAREFEAPAWFGRELTAGPRWSNQRLAVEGKPPHAAS